jgi:excisionase family DNA binding protein
VSALHDDEVLNTRQVVELLGVDRKTLERYLHTGQLRAVKHGNRWFIRRSAVEDFLTPDVA